MVIVVYKMFGNGGRVWVLFLEDEAFSIWDGLLYLYMDFLIVHPQEFPSREYRFLSNHCS